MGETLSHKHTGYKMKNFDAIDELLEKARIDYENNKPADDYT